jgi:hypothetical protein
LNIFQEEIIVKGFIARRFSQVGDEIIADRDGSENQVISDIHVKSFLTRGWGDIEASYRVAFKELFLCPQILACICTGETPVPPV